MTLVSLQAALDAVLTRACPLDLETIDLEDAAWRVLGETATASVDLPPFPASAMDGYAVQAADVPGSLPVVFRIAAGRPAPGPLQPGQAMAVATGGVVPDGADAVVPIERATETGDGPTFAPGGATSPRVKRSHPVVQRSARHSSGRLQLRVLPLWSALAVREFRS
jgi:molybdopterin molybdotransferase